MLTPFLTSGRLSATWVNDVCNRCDPTKGLFPCDAGVSHELRVIHTQSSPEKHGLLVCICERCKKTLNFQTFTNGPHCQIKDNRVHHLVLSDTVTVPGDTEFLDILSTSKFACSVVDCTLVVTVEVCERRFQSGWEAALLNRNAVLERLKGLVEEDPNRFEKLMQPEAQVRLLPAWYMQLYIRDALDPSLSENGKQAKVSVRNKFYVAVFGDEFESQFKHMGFERVTEEGEQYVQLPMVDLSSQSSPVTPYRSKKARLEVIRAHLCCLLMQESQTLRSQITLDLPPAMPFLTKLLDAQYDATSFKGWADYPLSCYHTLGAKPDMSEWMLCYAATSQNQTNPSGRIAVFEALQTVSSNRETQSNTLAQLLNEESMFVATQKSKEEDSQTKSHANDAALAVAYGYLQSKDWHSDDDILNRFSQKTTSEYSMHTDKSARHSLYLIAQSRKSSKLMQSAVTFDDPEKAATYLGVTSTVTPDFAVSIIAALKASNDSECDLPIVANAAKELVKRYDKIDPDLPYLLEHVKKLESEAAQASGGLSLGTESSSTGANTVNLTIPAGLDNIRNTCYLNSILQYFNTIVPVRDVVLNWERYKLEPTDENITSRRLGGSGSELDKGKAFLAGKFVEEMRSLFVELQNSDQRSVKPTQRLALAALNNAKELVDGKPQTAAEPFIGPELPPRLPPRSSPKPPADAPTGSTGPTVSVNPVGGDGTDTASDVSSTTLVGDDKSYVELSGSVPGTVPAKQRTALDDDVKDKDDVARGRSTTREGETDSDKLAAKPLSLEEKIQAALDDKSKTGTDQQDIEEIMGNILEHLHAAVKPESTDKSTGLQTDIITDTFYWSNKMCIRDLDLKTGQAIGEPRSKVDISRWITAFPGDKNRTDLYTALDRSFDREHDKLNSKLSEMYNSITKSPPILHIYIQRSQTHELRNSSIVEIPETLYLDRYMDGDENSDIMKTRQRSWNLKGRLQTLNNPPATTSPTDQASKEKDEGITEVGYEVIDPHLDDFADAVMSIDTGEGDGQDEYVSILDAETRKMLEDAQLLPAVQDSATSMPRSQEAALINLDFAASKRAQAQVEKEKALVQAELSSLFTDMKDVSYRLHAVICHGGRLKSGHYWAFIYDFKKHVWRKYNDHEVTEYSDSAQVLAILNSNAEPYYLAYVRENMVDSYVTTTERTPQPQTIGNADGQSGDAEGQAVSGNPPSGDGGTGAQSRLRLPSGRPEDPMQMDGGMNVMHVEDRDD